MLAEMMKQGKISHREMEEVQKSSVQARTESIEDLTRISIEEFISEYENRSDEEFEEALKAWSAAAREATAARRAKKGAVEEAR